MLMYTSTGAFVGIFYEAILAIILIILCMDLLRIYRTTKFKMSLYLFLGWFGYFVGIVFAWIGKIWLWQHDETILIGDFFLQLIYKFKFSSFFVILGNYFFLRFFQEIFEKEPDSKKKKMLILIKIIELTIVITIHIPAYLQSITDPVAANDIALMTDAVAFLIMFLDTIVFVPLGIKAFKSVKNGEFGKKYRFIGLSAFLLVNMCIMFLLDRMTMMANIPGPFGELGYTPFYFAAWGSAIASNICAIYGFVKR